MPKKSDFAIALFYNNRGFGFVRSTRGRWFDSGDGAVV
jgi:hypothetical protein